MKSPRRRTQQFFCAHVNYQIISFSTNEKLMLIAI